MNRLDDSLGTVEVGKEADLIVVDGDPLENFAALERVEMAMIAGTQML
jgi:imidazolonepropionase-like amidohydrolase